MDFAITDLGLEVELDAGDQRERWRGRVHLDWGPLPGSYAWVFPTGDVLTVGVIAERGEPDRTREYLADFRSRLGLEHLLVVRSSGHLTRCRREGSPLRRGRVLVAADAAAPASYATGIEQTLGPEMTAGLLCRRAFSAHPGVFHLIVGSTRPGWRFFGRFTRGETTLAGALRRRRVRLPLRVMECGSRRAGTG